MKVADLIAELQKLDPELPIYVWYQCQCSSCAGEGGDWKRVQNINNLFFISKKYGDKKIFFRKDLERNN